LFKGGKSVFSIPTKSYEALCISVKPGGSELAVGGDDNNVHIYTIDGDTLAEKQVINLKTGVISIAYSPDGAVLATGEKSRAILIYDASTYAVQNTMWKYHTAAVNCTVLVWFLGCEQTVLHSRMDGVGSHGVRFTIEASKTCNCDDPIAPPLGGCSFLPLNISSSLSVYRRTTYRPFLVARFAVFGVGESRHQHHHLEHGQEDGTSAGQGGTPNRKHQLAPVGLKH
jgi:WD40 repeat protein